MKKFLSLSALAVCAVITLSACSAAVPSPFTRSGYLNDHTSKIVSPVTETAEYAVSYVKNANVDIGVEFTLDDGASYLKTDLSVVKGDGVKGESGKDYYLFRTETKIVGTYVIDGTSTPCTSEVSSAVYFGGLSDDLRPVYSERNVLSTTPKNVDGKYILETYKFAVSTVYGDGAAKVTVTPEKVADEEYSVSGEYTIEKVFEKNYIDNELLLFAPRAMSLSSSLSTTFSSIDALARSLDELRLVYAKDDVIKFKSCESKRIYAGSVEEARTSVKVVSLTLSKNSTYAGAAQTLSFAAADDQNEYSRLIKLSYPAAYSTGTFDFIIRSSSISFN